MPFIKKLHTARTQFVGETDDLSRSEQVEILWRAWTFAAVCGILACIGTLIVMVTRLVEILT